MPRKSKIDPILKVELVDRHPQKHPDIGYQRIRDELDKKRGIAVKDKRVLRICRKEQSSPFLCYSKPCELLYRVKSEIKRRGMGLTSQSWFNPASATNIVLWDKFLR